MKEDYLWDKKGSDAEIENLENALKAFRQKDLTPPELPTKTFVVDKTNIQNESPRRFLQFALAGFASLALVIISIGAFQILSSNNQTLSKNTSEKVSDKETTLENLVTAKQNKKTEDNEIKNQTVEPKFEKAKFVRKRVVKNQLVKRKKRVTNKTRYKNTLARKVKPKSLKQTPETQTVRLTKEEKDAYDQVMRALAITGSQMRIVQEKIKGEQSNPATKKDGR